MWNRLDFSSLVLSHLWNLVTSGSHWIKHTDAIWWQDLTHRHGRPDIPDTPHSTDRTVLLLCQPWGATQTPNVSSVPFWEQLTATTRASQSFWSCVHAVSTLRKICATRDSTHEDDLKKATVGKSPLLLRKCSHCIYHYVTNITLYNWPGFMSVCTVSH